MRRMTLEGNAVNRSWSAAASKDRKEKDWKFPERRRK
jgi:hypothetical protein